MDFDEDTWYAQACITLSCEDSSTAFDLAPITSTLKVYFGDSPNRSANDISITRSNLGDIVIRLIIVPRNKFLIVEAKLYGNVSTLSGALPGLTRAATGCQQT